MQYDTAVIVFKVQPKNRQPASYNKKTNRKLILMKVNYSEPTRKEKCKKKI